MRPNSAGLRDRLRWPAILLGSLGLALQIGLTAANPARYQFDFTLSYDIAHSKAAEYTLRDLYPPYRPLFFAPFLLLPRLPAYYAMLAFKVALLAAALRLGVRLLRPRDSRAVYFAFSIFAFNGALPFDLRSGNVATVELLLLYAGFWFFERRRYLGAAIHVVLASLLKILPLGMLAVLPLARSPRATKALAFGSLLALGLLGLPLLLVAGQLRGAHLISSSFDSMRGPVDTSLLALVRDVSTATGHIPSIVVPAIYGLLASTLLILSWKRATTTSLHERDPRALWCFVVLAYTLTAPRMVTYSYSLCALPVFYLLGSSGWTWRRKLLLIAICAPTQQFLYRIVGRPQDAGLGPAWLLPLEYSNWLGVFAAWWVIQKSLPRAPRGQECAVGPCGD